MTPPELIGLADHDGDWSSYEAALYGVFQRDILDAPPIFRGLRISARRLPEHERRWASYWHLISEGRVEDERLPDLRRCERLRWVRWCIENADEHPDIDVWQQTRRGERNVVLWYDEAYMVVLGMRGGYYLLRTAFFTDREHNVRRYRRERDASNG